MIGGDKDRRLSGGWWTILLKVGVESRRRLAGGDHDGSRSCGLTTIDGNAPASK